MADIAFIFHWPPDQLDAMCPFELADWHALAVSRWDLTQKGGHHGGR